MLEAMRQLALDSLYAELGTGAELVPETWYRKVRENDPGRLFSKLVERSERIERYYTLGPDTQNSDLAILEVHDLRPGDLSKLPFNQPTGSQSPALGPVIKRTWKASERAAGPSAKIQTTTLNDFERIAAESLAWSPYFAEAANCFRRSKVRCAWDGRTLDEEGRRTAFGLAISAIPETHTVFLAYRDMAGRSPGEVPEYVKYLQNVLVTTKYTTREAPAKHRGECPLCGQTGTVYPNALKGAGINLSNVDRDGAFPGVDVAAAWKGYALCGACADLLYIYKNHTASDFLATVAGDRALVIPVTEIDPGLRHRFVKRVKDLVKGTENEEVAVREERLMRLLGDDAAVTSLTFLWATFGQSIDDVKGILMDVLPSRLRRIDDLNREIRDAESPLFPQRPLDDFSYNLRLSVLGPLLKRPGGKKATAANASKRLFDLRRDLIASIYYGRIGDQRRFWEEVLLTARWHLDSAAESGQEWGLLYEGFSEKKHIAFLTAAGWVRQLVKFLHYLRKAGVMHMPGEIYQPQSKALAPYFTSESAIDTREKAFAFILGALYGKVMQVQGARGVRVRANALTWLKRLTLTGKDLPALYVKVREKLLAYETESNPTVREVVAELGAIGALVGDVPSLDQVQTCYFLLLGQSLATTIMPGKSDEVSKGEGNE